MNPTSRDCRSCHHPDRRSFPTRRSSDLEHAAEVKSLESALTVRNRLLSAFEAAESEPDPQLREAWLTFVVVGAGPTGVEMRSEEHTSDLQSHHDLVCRLLLEKKKYHRAY